VAVAAVGLALSACNQQSSRAGAERTAEAQPDALAGSESLQKLSLDDGTVAYVARPAGASAPRPLIVGVHGALDRPESACNSWRAAASGYAFVVCPHGEKQDSERFSWDSAHTIAVRVTAAIAAARARFGAEIAEGPLLYAGFSQGATLARAALLEEEGRFPVALLAEGAYDLLSDPGFLSRLRARGTQRVALICGASNCFRAAEARKPVLERQGPELVVAGDAEARHNLDQRMRAALQAAWSDFVAGLPNWRGYQPSQLRAVKATR
jgi:predicted esterase